jgi:hypothetical protein
MGKLNKIFLGNLITLTTALCMHINTSLILILLKLTVQC